MRSFFGPGTDTLVRKIRFVRLMVLTSLTLLAAGVIAACTTADASPDQPIAFSHRAHTENEVECSFCHAYVERYDAAGIPRVDLCASCHSAMEGEDPEMQKIFEYEDAGNEIPWVRLYEIPQFTHFSHKWHIRADVGCQECHGDIGQSDRAVRHMVYDMDWCVTCHEAREASVDCVLCHK